MNRPASERFLVTGANGCIGAWVVHQLIDERADVVALDLSDDRHRLRLLLSDDELARVPTVRADITDLASLERTIDEHGITNVIHLAALQVPFCRADPPLGARVNVVGTVNVLEAVARRRQAMAPLVYASSVAVHEAPDGHDAGWQPRADGGVPGTLYGVYKRANEGAAAVYWRDQSLSNIGLRPHTVYGPGRDQGVTSAPTIAMLAAAGGTRFRIPYGGRLQLQYAPDAAAAFVAASRSGASGATVHNLSGPVVHMREIVAAISLAAPGTGDRITFEDVALPFPEQADSSSLSKLIQSVPATSLTEGVADTIARLRRLLEDGRLSPLSDDGAVTGEPAARANE